MQPMSMNTGYPQGYPIYANCFDRLTTNGILVEDVVGYITGTPSPYLQNYVAQRGWPASLPGRILPDALPPAPMPAPMSVPAGSNPVYTNNPPSVSQNNTIPTNIDKNTLVKKDKYETAKKIAAGALITGLVVFGAIKGVQLFKTGGASIKTMLSNGWNKVKNFFNVGTIKTKLSNGWNKVKGFFNAGGIKTKLSNAWNVTKNWCTNAAKTVGNFFKNMWNKIFH